MKNKNTLVIALLALVVIAAGVGTGWFLTDRTSGSSTGSASVASPEINTKDEVGLASEDADTAEGALEEGGIEGEGTHHLVRPGGEDQMVYLTSTVVDLQPFVGKNVQVWGKTVQARSAPWLMDVERVKVIK